MTIFFQNLAGGIETGSMYALAAMGLVLIYQTSKMTNFSQGTLGMFNTFVCVTILGKFGVPLWLSVLFALAFALALGMFIDFAIMSRIKRLTPLGKQIITLGFIIIFTGLTPMFFGTEPIAFSKFIDLPAMDIAGVNIHPNSMLTIGIAVTVMLVLFYFLKNTKWGLAVRVTASNPVTARLMGVPTSKVTMGSWGVATFLGCLAAIMVAPASNVTVSMMDGIHINSFIAAVLGGFGTFHGPVVGAFILGIANNLISYYISTEWSLALLYGFILIFIIIKPNGLFGKKIIKKV